MKVVALEKISFSTTQNAKSVFYHIQVDGKHYLLHRGKLTKPIQMQLSQKLKAFSEFFFAFLKSILNFRHLLKKMTA